MSRPESPGPAGCGRDDLGLGEWVRALPKAEVHLHLEGCIPADLVAGAARRLGIDPLDAPRLPVTDLPTLLDYLDWSCQVIDRPEDLATIAYSLVQRASASGARHVDVIANPTHWPAWSDRVGAFAIALHEGFAQAAADGFGSAALCLSIKRSQTAGEAMELVRWIVEHGRGRVAGLSIDGDERDGASSHTERFRPSFERAEAAGIRRCAHAGESSGPEGVRAAMDALRAERIDHGVRCAEDPTLVRELADRRVPLDICPTSNVTLGVARSLADHPVEQLRRAGVRFSLNTDDPMLYGIDLAGEYVRCAEQFGWGRADLAAIARTSIESSFAEDSRRRALLEELDCFVG